MAAQVRVVLGMLPPLLGGIVRRLLAAEPGVTVVGLNYAVPEPDGACLLLPIAAGVLLGGRRSHKRTCV